MEKGTLYWLTGLSGAGKTTVGMEVYKLLAENGRKVVFLDGDMLRDVYNDYDYTVEGRDRVAARNGRLTKLLTDQGLDVLCCVVGMKDKYRDWNRANISNYVEIYLKVSMDELFKRNKKGLYQSDAKNVMGRDIKFEEPKTPDLIVENEGSMSAFDSAAKIANYILNK